MALAVLAFVVQLIVFIVQASDAARSSERAQILHAQTMLVLAQLQERTQGTQQSIERMNTRLLEAVLGKVAGEGLDPSSPAFAERVVSGLRASQDTADETEEELWPPPLDKSTARRIHEELSTWPTDEEAPDIVSTIMALPERSALNLGRIADDAWHYTRPNTLMGPGAYLADDSELKRLGLIEPVPNFEGVRTLSPAGRRLARVLVAAEPVPEAFQALTKLRQGVADLVARGRLSAD
jgi:hypothetical protein